MNKDEMVKTLDELAENNRDLIETIEIILFRFGQIPKDEIRQIDQWVIDICVMALFEAGVERCAFDTSNGQSADYNITNMYKEIFED